jgi:hypothetical protein
MKDLIEAKPPLFDKCECGVCKEDMSIIEDPGKPDEEGSYIKQYFHCKTCMPKKPKTKSPSQWARLAVGFTAKGLEVWCIRCQKSIINLDFQGMAPGVI